MCHQAWQTLAQDWLTAPIRRVRMPVLETLLSANTARTTGRELRQVVRREAWLVRQH